MLTLPAAWPYPRLIAHRGAGRHAPENTLAAVRLGAQHGFAMVEYDVKLSRDDIAILLHDDRIDRTSNGTGNAGDMSYSELARLDFGAWHSPAFAGEPLATLYSIAAFTRSNGMASNIELKPHTGTDAHTGTQIARLARELWADADVPPLLSSFSDKALQAARAEAPALPRALLIERELPDDWRATLTRLDCIALHMNDQYTSKDAIRAVRSAGYGIAIYTVNDPVRARQLFDWGCAAIFTDETTTISPHL